MSVTFNLLDHNFAVDDTGNIATQATASVTPTAGRLYLLDVVHYGSTGAGDANVPTGVAGFGLSWTLMNSRLDPALSAGCVSTWAAVGAPTPGAVTVTFRSGRPVLANGWVLREAINADLSGGVAGAFVQSAVSENATGTANNAPVTLATFGSTNNAGISAFFVQNPSPSVLSATPLSGWAELTDQGAVFLSGTSSLSLQTQTINGVATSANATWSGNVAIYGLASEIKGLAPAGAALAATPAATVTVTADLSIRTGFGAQPAAVSTVSASLTTQARLGATPVAGASCVASLTNFASVVLTEPRYIGVGSIYDQNFWLDAAPVVGNTIWYDPIITVAANGEISAATNNCQAVVQFNSG